MTHFVSSEYSDSMIHFHSGRFSIRLARPGQRFAMFDPRATPPMIPLIFSRNRWQLCLMTVGIIVFSSFGTYSLAWAQTEPIGSLDKTDFRYTVHSVSESGGATFVPEKWSTLEISLVNARSEPREVLCSTYFEQDSRLQYGRRVWVPAQSKLRIDQPVQIPKCDRNRVRNLELHSLVFDVSSKETTETLLRNDAGGLKHDGALIVTHDTRNTGILAQPTLDADSSRSKVEELVVACRVQIGLTNILTSPQGTFLVPDETRLAALDQIVIADDRIVGDFAAMTALRRWVNAGGHLWVMLDNASPVVLEMLLGDDFTGYVVDRVRLTSVRIDEAAISSNGEGKIGLPTEYDDPVDLVRMTVTDVTVSHVVNGWPAAMTKQCGDGMVLMTTLGARAWMKPLPESAERSKDPTKKADYTPTGAMINLANDFFRVREPQLIHSGVIEPQVREYIGYGILSWWLIVGTLLGFSAAIVAVGIWLLRRGQLEQMVWVGSAIALVASLLLIVAGRTNRRSIPATMASVELVQTLRGTDDLRSEGFLSTYHPEGSEYPIEVTHGGRMIPDMTGLEQTSRRMVTTDLGVNHWESLRQPAGVRSTSFDFSECNSDRTAAYVTFDSQGISGRYVGAVPPGTDPVLATRDGRLGLSLNADGTFVGRGDHVFEKDQYLAAGLLTDEQDRRRRTLKELLDNPKRRDYPGLPQLMFWSGPSDNGFHFGEGLKQRGSALVAVPIVVERPANGTEMMIPSPFVSYINRPGPDGSLASPMWNNIRHEWQERVEPGLAWLSFQIPRELAPVVARRARIEMKVTGPIGRVEILGLKNGNVVSLKTVTNPVGSLSIDITDADAMSIDRDGRLALGLNAGDPEPTGASSDKVQSGGSASGSNKSTKANYWRIESLSLRLWAATTEPAGKD